MDPLQPDQPSPTAPAAKTTQSAPTGPDPQAGVILAPRPWVPLGVVALGLACLLLLPLWGGATWLALGVGVLSAAFKQGRLDATALSFDNAQRLARHYLEGFGWTTTPPSPQTAPSPAPKPASR